MVAFRFGLGKKLWKFVLLGSQWLMSSIVDSLLNDPNTSSPANVEASNLYKDNRREYTKRVRETVEKSWDDQKTRLRIRFFIGRYITDDRDQFVQIFSIVG